MFNTKNVIVSISEVPSYWIFEYYLHLNQKLVGQDIKIKSIFNLNDKTPSMGIYVDKKLREYKYKDFSTGKSGGKIDIVKELFNLNYVMALDKIIEDYSCYIKNNNFKSIEFKPQPKWNVDYMHIRSWNDIDRDFWLPYGIGSSILTEYNVKPIEYYNMVKEDEGQIKQLKVEGRMIYGYFTKDNNIYKIYQPQQKEHKFFKITSYLQGLDQLKYNQPYLVICSSLKDAMCLKGFNYNLEVIAPDSENTIIKPYIIENLKEKYKTIITLFDNDIAGHNAIEKYKELYGLNGTSIDMCKDISDATKEYGFEEVHKVLKPLLKKTLNIIKQ